ncbi:MAG: ABC transporter ATP-binding protein [Ruminococcus sp.]|nr:ABC transporter ATP-binding protein [Ruminococcus sp.]
MIEIKNLKKSFGSDVLFDGLNLTLENNKITAIVGASGCGKSTLLNIIGAIEPFDDGEVIVDGIDISKNKNKLLYFREKVGFLFQNFALVENKTVLGNMEIVNKNYRMKLSIEDCLKEVGLEDKINSKVCTLSGGQQQRVALARLMLKKCSIILADEPTGSLDKENGIKVFEILKSMNTEQNKTIVVVTHDLDFAQKCDTVIHLNNLAGSS